MKGFRWSSSGTGIRVSATSIEGLPLRSGSPESSAAGFGPFGGPVGCASGVRYDENNMVRPVRIAVDIGGTFTDVAMIAPDGTLATYKLLSTPTDYADAVIQGVQTLIGQQGLVSDTIEEVLHGCTVATNAILEHRGAKTALITTKGFRDVLELRRTRVPRLYDALYQKPPPLVPRRWRFEVAERMDATGQVVSPLDVNELHSLVGRIQSAGVEAVAVCLLHSYANAAHEEAIGRALKEQLPGLFVSLSAQVLPQMREYERTSTTVINSYVGPPVRQYLQSMIDQFAEAGIHGRFMVMQSSGGILDASAVLDRPSQIVECGPAAGVVGAAAVGRRSGYDHLITFDMGGTTAKVSIVEQGNLHMASSYEVGGGMNAASPLFNGGGYALNLPVVEISEVGAGGGSVVWLDKVGAIKVGPHSAGAHPGPACYGAGGRQPTVTDANVVLGYLNPRALAGGSVPVDSQLAREAIQRCIAQPLDREVIETAFGIHGVANANMMRPIKMVTTYRGRDPRGFALMAFGGSGGVHAVALARQLQIKRVVVPPAAGVFSALGLLLADAQVNVSRAFHRLCSEMDGEEAERIYAELEHQAVAALRRDPDEVSFHRLADLRYAGQAFELTIDLPTGQVNAAAVSELSDRFEAEHERVYGNSFAGEYPLETVNLRVVGRVPRRESDEVTMGATGSDDEEATGPPRDAYFGPDFGMLKTPVLNRQGLKGRTLQGPLIIEEYEGTIVVPPDCSAHVDDRGNMVFDLGGET